MLKNGLVSLSVLILFAVTPVLYTNCGSQHQGTESVSATSVLKPVFKETFHPFLVSNCSSCHVRGGSGNGKFASSTVDEAFDDFYYMGYSKIAAYAVDAGHNYPFTGPEHEQEINQLVNKYKEVIANSDAVEEDSDIYAIDAQIVTSSKILGFNSDGERTFLWNLKYNTFRKSDSNEIEDELLEKIEITSEAAMVKSNDIQIGYSFGAPRIHLDEDADTDIYVLGAVYQLNDALIEKNTFYSLGVCVRKGESGILSSSGSIYYDRKYIESDRLSVHILSIEKTTCSKPEEEPKVSFAVAETRVQEGSPPTDYEARKQWAKQSYPTVTIQVRLDKAPKVTTYVSVERDDSSDTQMIPRCCIELAEEELRVYNGLWDYDFNRADLVFYPPEDGEEAVLVKEIVIPINDDERITDFVNGDNVNADLAEEKLVLKLTGLVNTQAGDKMKTDLIIVNDDSLSSREQDLYDGLYTYEGLYRNIFISNDENIRCIGCHNSVIRAKGYDITNYKHLISSEVVVPGDHNNSDFYRRIVLWKELGLQQMPLNENPDDANDSIDTGWYEVLQAWISNGAKNN